MTTPEDIDCELVACLGCAEVYAKPCDGSTVERNPGCPQCGYMGWLPAGERAGPGLLTSLLGRAEAARRCS